MMGEIGIVGREPMAASRFSFSGRVQETAFGCNHPMPRQLLELKNAQPLNINGPLTHPAIRRCRRVRGVKSTSVGYWRQPCVCSHPCAPGV